MHAHNAHPCTPDANKSLFIFLIEIAEMILELNHYQGENLVNIAVRCEKDLISKFHQSYEWEKNTYIQFIIRKHFSLISPTDVKLLMRVTYSECKILLRSFMNIFKLYYKHWLAPSSLARAAIAIANRNARKHHTFRYRACRLCMPRSWENKSGEDARCRFIGRTIIPNDFRRTTETTGKLVCNARAAAVNVAGRKSSSPCLNRRESSNRGKENRRAFILQDIC